MQIVSSPQRLRDPGLPVGRRYPAGMSPLDSPSVARSVGRNRFVWRLWPWWPDVTPETLRADALAGLLGAVLVLPQGIAFAALAGLPPQMGLAAAVLPAIVAALAGSSRQVVSGPTNANSLALGAMLAPLAVAGSGEHIELALALTLLVGLLQASVGLLRLGAIANFISPTALLGFTSGAAVLIAWHALPQALGLAGGLAGALRDPAARAGIVTAVQPGALLVAAATVGLGIALRRRWPRSPHLMAALIAATALGWGLQHLGLPTGARLGPVQAPWPQIHWPSAGLARVGELLGLAAALTVVALAQATAIARVVAERTGQRLDTNREFVGQGLANVVAGCTQSLVVCGSLNRSLPNLQAGARTPLAAVTAGVVLVPLVLAVAPMLAWLPHAAIAGLLLLVAASLLDLPRWRRLVRVSRTETTVAAVTFIATLALRLELAVLIGSALSLGLYLHRTAHPAMRTMGFDRTGTNRPFVVLDDAPAAWPECPQLKLLRMEGPVYFAATGPVGDRLQALRDAPGSPRHLLVMSKSMNFIDPAGGELWRHELQARRAQGGDLWFHRPRPQVLDHWRRDGFLDELGADHVFPDKRTAIRAICARLDRSVCRGCRVRVFAECQDPAVVAQPDDPAGPGPAPATATPGAAIVGGSG
jgi:SulP family sulfate permease